MTSVSEPLQPGTFIGILGGGQLAQMLVLAGHAMGFRFKEIFHAGTSTNGEHLVTNGGRVFGVTAQGSDISEARKKAYLLMEDVRFKGKHFRTDIGSKALN